MFWSFNYFFFFVYITIFFSIIFYLINSLKFFLTETKIKKLNTFDYLSGHDLFFFVLTPLFLFLIILFSWSGPFLNAWFNNLIFTSFQLKISYLILIFFFLVNLFYISSFYFSSKDLIDYFIVNFNFFFWIFFLFYCNNIFTFIFFIEILSTLIFLLIITSTFSTTFYYNNLNLNLYNYFHSVTPFLFTQILIFFFWISLISSLNLFVFLILFYLKFFTFDWFVFEFIFLYLISINNIKDILFLFFVWFNFLFCFFLKCGLVPFYFWKPTFFKGIPLHALFFYIFFFYFFIFLFFIFFLIVYVNEIFYFFFKINIVLFLIGIFFLFYILCEAYYLKAFLALSSILNTLFVFISLNGLKLIDFFFFL